MTTANSNTNTTFIPAFPLLWAEAIAEVAAVADWEVYAEAIDAAIEEADKDWLTSEYTEYYELWPGQWYSQSEIEEMEAAMAPKANALDWLTA